MVAQAIGPRTRWWWL